MEFWGVEVKPGETVKCVPGADKYLHLSQASLGEVKKEKGNESVPIFVKFNDQKLVIGTLSSEKCAQISYDLVFEKDFELSHNWKNGSVFFSGYKTVMSDDGYDDFSETDSEEEAVLSQKPNGKAAVSDEQIKASTAKPSAPKAAPSATKPKVKVENFTKPKEDDDEDDDEDEDDDDDDSEDGEDDEDMVGAGDDSEDDEDESSDDEDEATPKKAETGTKRPALSASKTPGPEKKAKLVTPLGSKKADADGKKGGRIATPYPAKQAGKTPANNDKSKQQTPKSGGSVSCKSCSKSFNSDSALQAHTKAKHSGK